MNDASATLPLQGIDHVREQFHNLHEFVAVARAKLDRNVWDYLIGGVETERRIGRLGQLGAALEQEPLVHGAVPRQRPDDADGPLDAAERVAEGAERFVSARHEDADLGIPAL